MTNDEMATIERHLFSLIPKGKSGFAVLFVEDGKSSGVAVANRGMSDLFMANHLDGISHSLRSRKFAQAKEVDSE